MARPSATVPFLLVLIPLVVVAAVVGVGGAAKGDPLVYSSFLGGGSADVVRAMGIGPDGTLYVAGATASIDFPVSAGAFDTSYGGGFHDCFVARFSADYSTLLFATLLGGASEDQCYGIAVDGNGDAFVTGITYSLDFPNTTGAYDQTLSGGYDAFVVKLSGNGSAVAFSTYLGGTSNDYGIWIGLDGGGNMTTVGSTCSSNFPTTAGAFDRFIGGCDAFVTRMAANGSSLVFSTVVGGTFTDTPLAGAMDLLGNVYLAGSTQSADFPTTLNAPDRTFGGSTDGFLAKLNASGSALAFGTFFGGSRDDSVESLAVGPDGTAAVVGTTMSSNFSTTVGAFDTTFAGGQEVFAAKVNASGAAIDWSTLLGTTADDFGTAVAMDANGQVAAAGKTGGASFPTVPGSYDTTFGTAATRGFVVRMASNGSAIDYGSFFGGTADNHALALYLAPSGSVLIGGQTGSSDFPMAPAAFQGAFAGGGADGFLAVLELALQPVNLTITSNPAGLEVFVDGSRHLTPLTVSCFAFSLLSLDVVTTQGNETERAVFYSWSDGGPPAHLFACGSRESLVVDFFREYAVNFTTEPPGHPFTVQGLDVTGNYSGWWLSGSRQILGAAPCEPIDPDHQWCAARWSDDQWIYRDVMVFGPIRLVLIFERRVRIEIHSQPEGLSIRLDGYTVQTPTSQFVAEGANHTLDAGIQQWGEVSRYSFRSWSDGAPVSHAVFIDAFESFYAAFALAHVVWVRTDPPLLNFTHDGVNSTSPQFFWWVEGDTHTLGGVPIRETGDGRLVFDHWNGTNEINWTIGATSPLTFTLYYVKEWPATVLTSPPGLQVVIDGVTVESPARAWWREGSEHEIAGVDPQSTADQRNEFVNWSDGGALRSRNVSARPNATYEAHYNTYFRARIEAVPPGAEFVVDGDIYSTPFSAWWIRGSRHSLGAVGPPGSNGFRYNFSSWNDGGAFSHSITASAPADLVAHYVSEFLITIRVEPAGQSVVADGEIFNSTRSFWWVLNSTHELGVQPLDPTGAGGMRFANWSDGGAANHSITVVAPATLIAFFEKVPAPPAPPPPGISGGPLVPFLLVAAAGAGGAVVFAQRRRRRVASPEGESEPAPDQLPPPLLQRQSAPIPVDRGEFSAGLPDDTPGFAPCPTCGHGVAVGALRCDHCGIALVWD